jgi:hypothetical protein
VDFHPDVLPQQHKNDIYDILKIVFKLPFLLRIRQAGEKSSEPVAQAIGVPLADIQNKTSYIQRICPFFRSEIDGGETF